ncbi:MAG TPA: ATP-binding protein [Anaerolineae bacterium]|nr:ATP-binding protein [Anaerolineae bacterium]
MAASPPIDPLFELSQDLLGILDENGKLIHSNPRWTEVLGHDVTTLNQSPLTHYLHPDDKHLLDTSPATFIARFKGLNNHWHYLNCQLTPQNHYTYIVAQDVTHQHHTQTRQADIMQRQAWFSQGLTALTHLSTQTYTAITDHLNAYLTTGTKLFDMEIAIISRIIPPNYLPLAVQSPYPIPTQKPLPLENTLCQKAFNTKQSIAQNKQQQHPAQQLIPDTTAYISAPIYVQGTIYGTLSFATTQSRTTNFHLHHLELLELMAQGISHFLTLQPLSQAREQALIALQQSEENLRTTLASMDDIVFTIDSYGLILSYYQPIKYLTFQNADRQLVGQQFQKALSPNLTTPLSIAFNTLRTTGDNQQFDYHLDLDGQRHWFSANVTARRDTQRQFDGITVVARDITRRRFIEEQLAQQTRELARSNAELEQFAYVVSHDLRAPLRAMNTYSLFLHEDYQDRLDEDGLEYIEGIAESAKHMENLVVDLLEYSRIGRKEVPAQPISLADLLDKIIRQNQLDTRATIHLPDNLPTLTLPPVYLEQIFTNLLNNAAKYCRPDIPSIIHISCQSADGWWRFAIKDNGIGIDPNHFDKIFGVFQRLHTQDEFEGTGIGLAIVKKALTAIGGDIHIDSALNQGTTFTFILPQAKTPSP